ncbi:DNA-binding response regulator, OmpR family, contains REC and winged-helix (wHTH) domain [Nocardioides alpinus]|uniref:DNA-binding response regulator n=1 Tax=Nocardioides alpinus TaxID=748909 RepID=A0A1I1A372_9ACTN|nr:response regulator transcription factor [Nocardioides alpinus]PKH42136.1 DNA-binding response regulator [Nocardioides alpinus]SFB32347.1 DNA-binding response regulator, OmpR family, contains REC and winged-helix (wHTH) domain [Nocardioides alpinus]
MIDQRTAVVVEDDHDVGDLISGLLDKAGFDVAVARTGADALTIIREQRPDLVTLDLTLPDIDGVEVCRQIRLVSDCYVIVVSARTGEVDRLIGLEVGADDYLVKPFSMRELQARVAALFRRPRNQDSARAEVARTETVRDEAVRSAEPTAAGEATRPSVDTDPLGCSDLTLNTGAREVLVSGEEIDLTRTEFDLLAHLVSNPGVVVPREALLRAVWDTEFVPDSTHVVDVHLANLRRKLRGAASDNQWIRTIRGVGFRFDPCCN